ncbi:MAG: GNAT family protein [Aerococcaceae bacterium]|nr:GNAT family protein [Aerococcaceae bacterium]
MAITGISQPDSITIDPTLRLRKINGDYHIALPWYQDAEIVWLVDGDDELYTEELLQKMYTWWSNQGEVYWIEILQNGTFTPIGDVSFNQKDLPIVIGNKAYWNQGIGTKVIQTMIQRAQQLGYPSIEVDEIYDWNTGSQQLYTKLGFQPYEKTEKGTRYRLIF